MSKRSVEIHDTFLVIYISDVISIAKGRYGSLGVLYLLEHIDPSPNNLLTAYGNQITCLLEFHFPFNHFIVCLLVEQIQASIAQTSQRQSEALGRKRTARATAAAFARRSQGSSRNLRGRRNFQGAEHHISDEEEDDNHDVGKDSSSADDPSIEVKPKRQKKRVGRPSLASAASDENDAETNQEPFGACSGLIRCSEILAWGKGGMRSNNRHGVGGGIGKVSRSTRVSKLIASLSRSDENEGKVMQINTSTDWMFSFYSVCG